MDEIIKYLGFASKESIGSGEGEQTGPTWIIAEAGGLEVHSIIVYTDMLNIFHKRKKRRIPCNVLTDLEKGTATSSTGYYLEAPPRDPQIREMNY